MKRGHRLTGEWYPTSTAWSTPRSGWWWRTACRRKRNQAKITDLSQHRHLFVQHDLTHGEKKTLRRITRGLPHLRALREIMNEVYRLFDRRCRTESALDKLARLREAQAPGRARATDPLSPPSYRWKMGNN